MALKMSTGLKKAILAKEEERKRRESVAKDNDMTLIAGSVFKKLPEIATETSANKQ